MWSCEMRRSSPHGIDGLADERGEDGGGDRSEGLTAYARSAYVRRSTWDRSLVMATDRV